MATTREGRVFIVARTLQEIQKGRLEAMVVDGRIVRQLLLDPLIGKTEPNRWGEVEEDVPIYIARRLEYGLGIDPRLPWRNRMIETCDVVGLSLAVVRADEDAPLW